MIGFFDYLRDPWWLMLWLAVPFGVWRSARRGAPGIVFAPAPVLVAPGSLPRSWRMRLAMLAIENPIEATQLRNILAAVGQRVDAERR